MTDEYTWAKVFPAKEKTETMVAVNPKHKTTTLARFIGGSFSALSHRGLENSSYGIQIVACRNPT